MTTISDKYIKVETVRKTKVETTYEYVPILNQILGYWRKSSVARLGDDIEIHIKTSLDEYDRLFINGKEIPIPQPKDT